MSCHVGGRRFGDLTLRGYRGASRLVPVEFADDVPLAFGEFDIGYFCMPLAKVGDAVGHVQGRPERFDLTV